MESELSIYLPKFDKCTVSRLLYEEDCVHFTNLAFNLNLRPYDVDLDLLNANNAVLRKCWEVGVSTRPLISSS
jgi:hypothetical protein